MSLAALASFKDQWPWPYTAGEKVITQIQHCRDRIAYSCSNTSKYKWLACTFCVCLEVEWCMLGMIWQFWLATIGFTIIKLFWHSISFSFLHLPLRVIYLHWVLRHIYVTSLSPTEMFAQVRYQNDLNFFPSNCAGRNVGNEKGNPGSEDKCQNLPA